MPSLRELVKDEGHRARVSPDSLERTVARAKRRQLRRQILAATLVITLFAGSLAGVYLAFRGGLQRAKPSGPLGQPQVMMSVRMESASVGWGLRTTPSTMVARYVMRTTDGGLQWDDVTPPTATVAAADFMSGARAWVVALDNVVPGQATPSAPVRIRIFATRNGGESWTSSLLPGFQCARCFPRPSVSFADATQGWVSLPSAASMGVGPPSSTIYSTADGGATWQVVSKEAPFDGSIRFRTATDGWGVDSTAPPQGRPSGVFRTTDGGRTWRVVSLRLPGSLAATPSVVFPEPPTFFGIRGVLPVLAGHGDSPQHALTFFTSSDGGATWSPTRPVFGRYLGTYAGNIPISIQSPSDWFFPSGDGHLFATTNAGSSWSQIRPRPATLGILQTGTLDFVSPTVAYAVTPAGTVCLGLILGFCSSASRIYRTSDGGRTWGLSISSTPSPEPTIPTTGSAGTTLFETPAMQTVSTSPDRLVVDAPVGQVRWTFEPYGRSFTGLPLELITRSPRRVLSRRAFPQRLWAAALLVLFDLRF